MERRTQIETFVKLINTYTPQNNYIAFSYATSPFAKESKWFSRSMPYRDVNSLVDMLEQLEDSYQVYLRMTPMHERPEKNSRGIESDASGSSVLWVDIDAYGRVDDAITALRNHPMPPTLIMSSGYGVSAYWLLDKFVSDHDTIKSRNKKLTLIFKALDGDSCFDLARVMRVPGTYNLKKIEPVLAHIIEYDETRVYSIDDFEPAKLDDDDRLTVASFVPEELPDNFAETLSKKRKKLWARMVHGHDAPVTSDGSIDNSKNDWFIACSLLDLGYDEGIVSAVLMHTQWISGDKYKRTHNTLYVLRTIAAAVRHVKGEAPRDLSGEKPSYYVPNGAYDTEALVTQVFELFDDIAKRTGYPLLYLNMANELCELNDVTDSGAYEIRVLNKHSLRRVVQQNAVWYTTTGKNSRCACTVPDRVLETMLSKPDRSVPRLNRIVKIPTFVYDDNGKPYIITKKGYYPKYKLFYMPTMDIDPISAEPTDEEIEASLKWFTDEIFVDFPFADDASKAHAIALALLPYVRDLISGSTPLHLFDAPIQASGKGKCIHAALVNYFGVLSATLECGNDDEWRKRLVSLARSGAEYLWIDNITKTLNWPSMAAALTTGSITERLLSHNDMINVPVRFLWFGTSNNATIGDDLIRRIAYCRINWTLVGVENPKDLPPTYFKHSNLEDWILSHRSEITHAALTLCMAGLQRGKPTLSKSSFESWARIMGTILNGIGVIGFLSNDKELRDMLQDNSTDKAIDIIEAAIDLMGVGVTFDARTLAERVLAERAWIIEDNIKQPQKFIGIMLGHNKDKVVCGGEYILKRDGDKRNGYKWRIEHYVSKGVTENAFAKAAD